MTTKNELVRAKCISGDELLHAFNNQGDDISNHKTLVEHIDFAISMAMKEAAQEQLFACIEAVRKCELVAPNVQRIRRYEAIGSLADANIYSK